MRDLDGHDHQIDLVAPCTFLGAAEGERYAVLLPAALADTGLLADSARTS
jgi:hypothetical protein